LGGKKYEADFENEKLGLRIHWEADLRDGAIYICQVFTFTGKDSATDYSKKNFLCPLVKFT